MPLLLLSGILLPMALAPDWLKFLSSSTPHLRSRRRAGAVQQRLGQSGDPDRRRDHGGLAMVAVWFSSRTFSRANA